MRTHANVLVPVAAFHIQEQRDNFGLTVAQVGKMPHEKRRVFKKLATGMRRGASSEQRRASRAAAAALLALADETSTASAAAVQGAAIPEPKPTVAEAAPERQPVVVARAPFEVPPSHKAHGLVWISPAADGDGATRAVQASGGAVTVQNSSVGGAATVAASSSAATVQADSVRGATAVAARAGAVTVQAGSVPLGGAAAVEATVGAAAATVEAGGSLDGAAAVEASASAATVPAGGVGAAAAVEARAGAAAATVEAGGSLGGAAAMEASASAATVESRAGDKQKTPRPRGRPAGKWNKSFAQLSQQGKSYRWKTGGAKAAVASSVSALERIGAETAEGFFY